MYTSMNNIIQSKRANVVVQYYQPSRFTSRRINVSSTIVKGEKEINIAILQCQVQQRMTKPTIDKTVSLSTALVSS